MSISGDSQKSLTHTFEPVIPLDVVRGNHHRQMAPGLQPTVEDRNSSDTSSSSLKSPRTARFAEATTVHSPTGPADMHSSPFADPSSHPQALPDVSDVGFGYVAANDPAQHASHQVPPTSPLKSALKVPGTPGRTLNPLSPTFREEFYVEKQEKSAEKENARDLVSVQTTITAWTSSDTCNHIAH